MADLFATVLRPTAEQRGLLTWEQLAAYAGEEWYPSRLAFGKQKGKSLADAGRDAGLRGWLEGLAKSANERNARMGRWYLRQLDGATEAPVFVAWESAGGSNPSRSDGPRAGERTEQDYEETAETLAVEIEELTGEAGALK